MPLQGNTDIDWSVSVGTAGGNREDLSDVITNITRKKTPFLSSAAEGEDAISTTHEWLIDELDTPTAVDATPEGTDAVFTATTDPVRFLNNTHLMRRTLMVTDTQESVISAGRASEIGYRLMKQMINLARQTEFNLWFSTFQAQTALGNTLGSPTGSARRMAGIREYLGATPAGQSPPAALTGTEQGTTFSPREFLSELRFNNFLQTIWDKHGQPDTIWTDSVQKRIISTFTANATKNFDSIDKRVINVVDVYESDFGMMTVHLHDLITVTELYALQFEFWRVSWLQRTKAETLARAGDATPMMIQHELTLEARAPHSSGRMFDLSNAFNDATAEGTAPIV